MNTERYIAKIIRIICLTNIPAILTLPWFYKISIGWITGSIASIGYFWWLSRSVKQSLDLDGGRAKTFAIKSNTYRFLALVVYAILVIQFIRPEIIIFGAGLLSSQIVIFAYEIYRRAVKKEKNGDIEYEEQ